MLIRRFFSVSGVRRDPWSTTLQKSATLVNFAQISPASVLGKDLDLLTANIHKLLGSRHPVLEKLCTYYFNQRGKHIRPLLVLLIAKATNTPGNTNQFDLDSSIAPHTHSFPANSYPSESNGILNTQRRLSEIIEMIHTASLLHDDVIDSSAMRRGMQSVNDAYGNKMAILAGDFLLSRASVALSRLRNERVVEIIADVIADLVEGEFMQLRNESLSKDPPKNQEERLERGMEHYIEKTYRKTASLISKSCLACTYLSDSTPAISDAAYTFGRNIGIAFQIVDDLLDFTVSESELGKPIKADLSLGIATAPVLYATTEYPDLWTLIDRKFSGKGDTDLAFECVQSSGALKKTKALAREYVEKAKLATDAFPNSEAKQLLLNVCDSVLERRV